MRHNFEHDLDPSWQLRMTISEVHVEARGIIGSLKNVLGNSVYWGISYTSSLKRRLSLHVGFRIHAAYSDG